MGSEIYNVEINLDGLPLLYATKVSFKRNKSTGSAETFNGTVNTSGNASGGSISIERLHWFANKEDYIQLEEILESGRINQITCRGEAYTSNNDPYIRTIVGTLGTITTDEEEWSPDDGITDKLDIDVNKLSKFTE